MGQLEHELLQLYRETISSHIRERKLQDEVADLKDRLEYAKQDNERLEKRLQIHQQRFRELDNANVQLTLQVMDLQQAQDACLDLIGEVIKDEAFRDQFALDFYGWKMGVSAPSNPSKDFAEGRDSALANAAMLALDMGYPHVRKAINQLIPEGSPARPSDTPPGDPVYGAVCGDAIEAIAARSPIPMPASPEDVNMPLRCLSCNSHKEAFYLCETCFELSIDHGCVLFEELQDAWDEGARDFPRPGKNAKELYKK
jgi:hypothetical protein